MPSQQEEGELEVYLHHGMSKRESAKRQHVMRLCGLKCSGLSRMAPEDHSLLDKHGFYFDFEISTSRSHGCKGGRGNPHWLDFQRSEKL
eukprot:scaffold35851_cov272-Skeletonema_dohrnii-CCMP3373.AAC.1